MGKRNYTCEQSWPKHPKKTVNELFEVAKLHGWTLIEETNHNAFRLTCPAGCCSFRVFSTGRAQENVLKSKRKDIVRCPHSKIADTTVREVTQSLDNLECLINATNIQIKLVETEKAFHNAQLDTELTELLHKVEDLEIALGNILKRLPQNQLRIPLSNISAMSDAANDESQNARSLLKLLSRDRQDVRQCWDRFRELNGQLRSLPS
ncbi:MAG: hypothetical protein Q4A82_00860 [Corynebacterium sp.]|nr:hypothetical protein [Corynebacterium sp.]